MIAAREKRRREEEEEEAETEAMAHPLDEAMEELNAQKQRQAHPSLQWKPSASTTNHNTSWYTKRQKVREATRVRIPTLLHLCLDFLVQNFDHVESLGPIGADVRAQVAAALVAQDKLDGTVLPALVHEGMESLELSDSAGLTADDLYRALATLLPAGLRYLHLDQCGRCFGSKAVEILLHHPSSLVALSIGGAYLWKDEQAAQVLQNMTNLKSIDFKACPLLGIQTWKALAAPRTVPLVELALEDLTLTDEMWKVLTNHQTNSFSQLERLKLTRMVGLTDVIVTNFLAQTKGTLQALALDGNFDLTDATLDAIRLYTSHSLRNLNLSGLKQLSAQALEALFTVVEGGAASPPPRLSVLSLSDLDHEAVTDNVLHAALVAAADVRAVGNASIPTGGGGGLVRLDLEGARALTDTTLEHLVQYCASSLTALNVSYCTSLTDQGLGYLVDHCGPQLREVQVWGLAQLTEAFLEGHRRCNDPTLVLTGIWMKKSSSQTIK